MMSGQLGSSIALWSAKGTPKDVIAKLNAAVVEALADPGVRQRLTELGHEVAPLNQQNPEALAVYYKAELDKEPINFTDLQYAEIKKKLIEQKALVTKYWGSVAEGGSLIVSGEAWISVGRLAMLGPAREEKVPVKLLAPKEVGPEGLGARHRIGEVGGETDELVLLKDAPTLGALHPHPAPAFQHQPRRSVARDLTA